MYIFFAGIAVAWFMLGYNLIELYQFWTNAAGSADYVMMIALIYELATITGPVALYGLTLFLSILAEFGEKTRYVLHYVPI